MIISTEKTIIFLNMPASLMMLAGIDFALLDPPRAHFKQLPSNNKGPAINKKIYNFDICKEKS